MERRSYLAAGVVLVLLGLLLLVVQMVPGLEVFNVDYSWPLIVVGVGVALLILGLVLGIPSLAIPAAIVGGIGGILFWQNLTGHWASWSYLWTLIPGFVGVGIMFAGFLGGERLEAVMHGSLGLIATSLVLFAIFGTFFGALGFLGPYWPIVLIALGVLLVGLSWGRPR